MTPRHTTAAALLLAIMAFPPASADWLQDGGNAAHAGVADGPGPATDDVALAVRLPRTCNPDEPPVAPLVIGGRAYAIVSDDVVCSGRAQLEVFEIDPSNATIRRVISSDEDVPYVVPPAAASDGRTYYVTTVGHVTAYSVSDWGIAWRADVSLAPAGDAAPESGGLTLLGAQCGPPALRDGVLYVACSQSPAFGLDHHVFVVALDRDGTILWRWVRDAPIRNSTATPTDPNQVANDAYRDSLARPVTGSVLSMPPKLSVVGPWVVVAEHEAPSQNPLGGNVPDATHSTSFHGIYAATGSYAWRTFPSWLPVPGDARANTPPPATGDADWVFFKGDSMDRGPLRDPVHDQVSQEFRSTGLYEGDVGSGLALAGDALYVLSLRELIRMTRALDFVWTLPLPGDEYWAASAPIVAGDTAYAMADRRGDRSVLYAVDAATGALRWRHEFGARTVFSVADGVVVTMDTQKQVFVLGTTEASPRAVAGSSKSYPQPGDLVTIDLSASVAGAQGPPTSYRADWGDGTVTEWGPSARFEHRYETPADREARFWVRNDANQTASVVVPFYVGRSPPLNFMQQAFAPDNQEQTFFALGLLITGAVAALGLWRSRRQRGILQRELHAVEQAFAMTKDRPADCEAALGERKAHCRGLLLDRRLDETQFALIERRIDELRGALRLHTLDERFHFLPVGIVRTLQGMLADGRINAWEHEHLVAVLERDQTLTPEYKARVRELIDGWYQRDAGGGSAPSAPDG